jgi:DNA polymerase-3 subunit alpha
MDRIEANTDAMRRGDKDFSMHSILAARSSFSIGESIITVEDLVAAAKAVGATTVALTDTMSVTGMIDFTNRAKKAGTKPIIGCRLRLVDDPTWRKTKEDKKNKPEYFLTYYVLSEKGLAILFKLLTLANTDERFYFTAKLGFDDLYSALADATADDVAIASSDTYSVGTHKDAAAILDKLKALLSENNVFLSLSPINTPYWDTLNKRSIELADTLGLPTLVTRPVLYGKGNATPAAVMNAVCRNVKVGSTWAWDPAVEDLHPLNGVELVREAQATMERLRSRDASTDPRPHFIRGLRNTDKLVDLVKYEWKKAPVSLPKMAPDEFRAVVELCKLGFAKRLGQETFGHKPTAEDLVNVYKPRLIYELGVIEKLKFSGYFLLVQDIVSYAKSNGILVGPGRGSVGGSLVAYLMGITDCDPIRFGLLFERFINPDRIDLPDADLDFMSERRHEIVDYLIAKYGRDRVAGISNFNSLAAASTIRDVGKAFGLSEDQTRCSKLVKKAHGANIELTKQVSLVPEIAQWAEANKPLWDICCTIEGSLKSMGRHAAGVVVGGVDLVERAVIERRTDGATINWDKRIVEDQGLVKVDILGLETLDLINKTLAYIRKRHSKSVNLLAIPLNDEKVLDNFAKAKTTGIFQFESGGMRRLLKELGRDFITFDDITAATALYRPGPMESGMMDSYWKRKQGVETVEYDHELMEPILKPTFGVMVYQEQVMQVSRVIAGYSAPDADKLRKIMGKKLPEEMAKERGKFCDGCVKTVGCTADWAGDLFDKIEGFAGYGFNKSHSVEYTLISYQAMWLKTNFPVEFYASALSLMKEEKLPGILKDANEFGVEVQMPDINLSTGQFEILNDTTLCIPFNRVKGISENTTGAILKARETGPFISKADLTARVERRKCNVRHVETLDKIGAFTRVEPGQLPWDHPDRIKDQRELIPGLVASSVPIRRDFASDKDSKIALIKVVGQYRHEQKDDGAQVKPALGKDARFMVISDCPTGSEERSGQISFGDSFQAVASALSEVGLSRADGYWTSLIKRPKEGKQVAPAEIERYWPYLQQEIAITKTPIIVLMGSISVRHFVPDFKGKASDSPGKVIYSKELDANLVIGFNPGEIYHDPDKQIAMNEVFASVAHLLS